MRKEKRDLSMLYAVLAGVVVLSLFRLFVLSRFVLPSVRAPIGPTVPLPKEAVIEETDTRQGFPRWQGSYSITAQLPQKDAQDYEQKLRENEEFSEGPLTDYVREQLARFEGADTALQTENGLWNYWEDLRIFEDRLPAYFVEIYDPATGTYHYFEHEP